MKFDFKIGDKVTIKKGFNMNKRLCGEILFIDSDHTCRVKWSKPHINEEWIWMGYISDISSIREEKLNTLGI